MINDWNPWSQTMSVKKARATEDAMEDVGEPDDVGEEDTCDQGEVAYFEK